MISVDINVIVEGKRLVIIIMLKFEICVVVFSNVVYVRVF